MTPHGGKTHREGETSATLGMEAGAWVNHACLGDNSAADPVLLMLMLMLMLLLLFKSTALITQSWKGNT